MFVWGDGRFYVAWRRCDTVMAYVTSRSAFRSDFCRSHHLIRASGRLFPFHCRLASFNLLEGAFVAVRRSTRWVGIGNGKHSVSGMSVTELCHSPWEVSRSVLSLNVNSRCSRFLRERFFRRAKDLSSTRQLFLVLEKGFMLKTGLSHE
jgi:hypothetical protein